MTLRGRLMGFMGIRVPGALPTPREETGSTIETTRSSTVGQQPWSNLVAWFSAMFRLPSGTTYGMMLDEPARAVAELS